MMNNQEYGEWGEKLAHYYLQQQGYIILHRNWRSKKAEVDLIAFHNNRIVFIEVKTRANTLHGELISFITNKKINLLRQAIEDYLNIYNLDFEAQIDIFCIEGDRANYKIDWIPNSIS